LWFSTIDFSVIYYSDILNRKIMKLLTNENNPLSLKVLISANFAQKELKLEIASVNGRFRLNITYVKRTGN